MNIDKQFIIIVHDQVVVKKLTITASLVRYLPTSQLNFTAFHNNEY